MNAIVRQLNKLQGIRNGQRRFLQEVLTENREFVSELNQNQLSEGQTATGGILPEYSPTSVNVFGKPPGPIKLFDTGDFYKGIEEQVFDDSFELIGTDGKTEMLKGKYGSGILGLTAESKNELIDQVVRPGLQRKNKEFIQR